MILTDVDALYDAPPRSGDAKRIAEVSDFSSLDSLDITGSDSKVGSGGMITKIEAARIASSAGIPTLLTDLEHAHAALTGDSFGTYFVATGERLTSRRLWLAHASTVRGRLYLDAGAVKAIEERGSSLLPAGVVKVDGDFFTGDTVELVAPDARVIAKGLIAYDSAEIPKLLGQSTQELSEKFGEEYGHELIHRDEMVLL